MAAGFRVDLTMLDDAAAGVHGTIDRAAQQPVSKIPFDKSAIGDDQLAGALSDFFSGWQRGVNNLVKDGQQIVGRLTTAANGYGTADKDARGASDRIFQGTGPDPGLG